MGQKLEDSIRVGSTGTISSLMNKELDSSSSSQSASVSVSGNDSIKHRSPENTRRSRGPTTPSPWKRRVHKRAHRVPMLGSENGAVDKTPKREKGGRKVCIVEVVDTNCGVPSGSFSNRLKKLGFSKLSRSIV